MSELLKRMIENLDKVSTEKLKWTELSVDTSLKILARSAQGGTVEMSDADFVQLMGELGNILQYKHDLSCAIGDVLIAARKEVPAEKAP